MTQYNEKVYRNMQQALVTSSPDVRNMLIGHAHIISDEDPVDFETVVFFSNAINAKEDNTKSTIEVVEDYMVASLADTTRIIDERVISVAKCWIQDAKNIKAQMKNDELLYTKLFIMC